MSARVKRKTQWKPFVPAETTPWAYDDGAVLGDSEWAGDSFPDHNGLEESDVDRGFAFALHLQELESASADKPQAGTEEQPPAPAADSEDSDLALAIHLQNLERDEYEQRTRVMRSRQGLSQKVIVAHNDDPYSELVKHNISHLQHLARDHEADDDLDSDDDAHAQNTWNNKRLVKLRGGLFKDETGKIISKHDAELCGRKNATDIEREHDLVIGDVILPNRAANSLRHNMKSTVKGVRSSGRVESSQKAASECVLDGPTRLMLMKMINAGILHDVNGCVATGKEANVYHSTGPKHIIGANGAAIDVQSLIARSKEEDHFRGDDEDYAVKIFRTTLSDFRNRGEYVDGDHRYGEGFAKARAKKQIQVWARKEDSNLRRAFRAGISVPTPIFRRKHVLIMQFIGSDGRPAPTLRQANLSDKRALTCYYEVVNQMRALYQYASLVHADLSGYNILYHDKRSWLIDFGQAVECKSHPKAMEYLERDCENVNNLFRRKGVQNASEDIEGLLSVSTLLAYITTPIVEEVNLPLAVVLGLKDSFLEKKEVADDDDCTGDEEEEDDDLEVIEKDDISTFDSEEDGDFTMIPPTSTK